jgi:hypothetical protein
MATVGDSDRVTELRRAIAHHQWQLRCLRAELRAEDPLAKQRAGGRARARKLTPAERTEIARKAARTRWNS